MKQRKDNRRSENWGKTKKKIAQIIKEITGKYPTRIERSYAGKVQRVTGACLWFAIMPHKETANYCILGQESMTNLLKKYNTFLLAESGIGGEISADMWLDGKDKK